MKLQLGFDEIHRNNLQSMVEPIKTLSKDGQKHSGAVVRRYMPIPIVYMYADHVLTSSKLLILAPHVGSVFRRLPIQRIVQMYGAFEVPLLRIC